MEGYNEVICMPVITALVYSIISSLKVATNQNEKFMRWIPLLSMLLGMICSIVAFYTIPNYLETNNILVALMIGASSGLSATGTHQAVKQLTTKKTKTNNTKNDKTNSTGG